MIATAIASALRLQPWEAQRAGRKAWDPREQSPPAPRTRLAFEEDEDEPEEFDLEEDEYDDDEEADDAFDDDDVDDEDDDDDDLDEDEEEDDV